MTIKAKTKPRIRISGCSAKYQKTVDALRRNNLNTVCESANCPNVLECWNKGHASFMILGNICTRKCSFCNIKTGVPSKLDNDESLRIALSVSEMELKHVVITSVTRDDLEDGGASHFAKTIEKIRAFCPETTIEVLTPDFLNKKNAIEIIANARPDVFNHNIETVPSLYRSVRPKANYFNSLSLLSKVKSRNAKIFTKSGLMLGLGEKESEVYQLMDDLKQADVDFLTISQYLRPTKDHASVEKYVSLDEFEKYKDRAYRKGFLMVSSSPLTRSSYHADEDFAKLKSVRNKNIH